MPQTDLRTVLITGVTRGLGRAMAEKFIELGHTIVGCGRSADRIEELHETFGQATPPAPPCEGGEKEGGSSPHRFDRVDVSDNAQVAEWAAQVLEEFGPPDLLVNNAATINRNAPLWEVPAEEFSHVIDVNIKGVANVIRHFVPAMMERGSGVIVNFSSGWGRSTSPEVAPYCTTKWAIEGLTQALAQELPRGMAAVPLNPGVIDTEMLRSCFGPAARRSPAPDRWAESAVPFLLKLAPPDNGEPLTVAL